MARERTIAAKISGVPLNMHVFLTPNTDGDESTIISGNVVAGRSLLHKVDAVLIPKSMLRFLEVRSACACVRVWVVVVCVCGGGECVCGVVVVDMCVLCLGTRA